MCLKPKVMPDITVAARGALRANHRSCSWSWQGAADTLAAPGNVGYAIEGAQQGGISRCWFVLGSRWREVGGRAGARSRGSLLRLAC